MLSRLTAAFWMKTCTLAQHVRLSVKHKHLTYEWKQTLAQHIQSTQRACRRCHVSGADRRNKGMRTLPISCAIAFLGIVTLPARRRSSPSVTTDPVTASQLNRKRRHNVQGTRTGRTSGGQDLRQVFGGRHDLNDPLLKHAQLCGLRQRMGYGQLYQVVPCACPELSLRDVSFGQACCLPQHMKPQVIAMQRY